MNGGDGIAKAIRAANADGRPALVAFLTAGYPDKARFRADLEAVAKAADVVEIGVPFTDPMADGVTIQRASRMALEAGVNLGWILDEVAASRAAEHAPLLLMGYLNPMLAFGFDALANRAEKCGVSGFIVPDLPLEESGPFREALGKSGLAMVQLVTPVTPADRLARLCDVSGGFVYAVTVTGITGGAGGGLDVDEVGQYLERVRAASENPVCAGFGVRNADQVRALGRHADGVVVGSALVEALEAGQDPGAFVRALRAK